MLKKPFGLSAGRVLSSKQQKVKSFESFSQIQLKQASQILECQQKNDV